MSKIIQLSDEMICYLGAGEIIHSIENFTKELLENSVDAGSTKIDISITTIGTQVKKITIIDNGFGIMKDDFPKLANRYNTSKITKYEDLQGIKSFGFRGEALNAISFNSLLTVISSTDSKLKR